MSIIISLYIIHVLTVVRCSLLPRLDSGNIQYSNELVGGSVATYECDRGYNLVGPMTRTCIKAELNSTTGIWSNLSSFCQGIIIYMHGILYI